MTYQPIFDAAKARLVQALYYAHGRNDQNGVRLVDPFDFAYWCAERADACERGDTSFLASIQDEFHNWFNR